MCMYVFMYHICLCICIDGFLYKGDTSTHAQGTDLGGLVERVKVRRHYGPLCSKLVAAVSGSICYSYTYNEREGTFWRPSKTKKVGEFDYVREQGMVCMQVCLYVCVCNILLCIYRYRTRERREREGPFRRC